MTGRSGQLMRACWHPSPPPKKAVPACFEDYSDCRGGSGLRHSDTLWFDRWSRISVSLLQVRISISIETHHRVVMPYGL